MKFKQILANFECDVKEIQAIQLKKKCAVASLSETHVYQT